MHPYVTASGILSLLGLPTQAVNDLNDRGRKMPDDLSRVARLTGQEIYELTSGGQVVGDDNAPQLGDRGQLVGSGVRHNSLLTLHGLVTRYVTGAHLTALRWLQQRKAGVRRAVATRPSGTTSDRVIEFLRDEQRTVALVRDGSGGIYLDAHGVSGLAHLGRDELWEFTDMLADLLDCDLHSRPNDGPI